jgi:hypothetical protein
MDEEAAADAAPPLIYCNGGVRFPASGERCDPTTTPAEGYCRTKDCRSGCEDECRCNTNGRWDCIVFCRDNYGCGKLPLCGVGETCAGDSGVSD